MIQDRVRFPVAPLMNDTAPNILIKHAEKDLYWNVVDGWVEELDRANLYTQRQVDEYAYELPISACWVKKDMLS